MKHAGAPYSVTKALRAIFNENANSLPTPAQRRLFHDYFVTHLPSSSLSPDKGPMGGPQHHKLPRSASQPHSGPSSRSAAKLQHLQANRDTTIVRIPIKSAKHHFGAGVSRGSRPYNEDTYQAGTIEIPAFSSRQPMSISRRSDNSSEGAQNATSESGDPQVFYFGVFDGHGGAECSEFLRDRLHAYIEESTIMFGLESSLNSDYTADQMAESEEQKAPGYNAEDLQKDMVASWKDTVGGYFKRFKPEHFPALTTTDEFEDEPEPAKSPAPTSIETVLTYAFLKADLDFTTAQATKQPEKEQRQNSSMDDPVLSDRPLNDNDVLFHPDKPASQNLRSRRPSSSPNLKAPIGGSTRFNGGSTASIAMVSTPTPTPFWHPASLSTLLVAHVGDTRILLCRTSDGKVEPLTTDHHPSAPVEANRMRRYAQAFVADSFGEERVLGLANTRAFGDIGSKRVGVSAEPEIVRIDLPPAEFSFIVLVSDGVSGHLSDQEIVDVVKEAKTPAQGATDLVNFAVEVSSSGDNATALVVRLGGWERRIEGGGGSLGTKEQRQFRRSEANDPRSRRQ